MDVTYLVDHAYEWTAKRVAVVRGDELDARTPCTDWNLRQLLNHMLGALTAHLDAADGEDVDPRLFSPDVDRIGEDAALAFGAVADRAASTWRVPGVLDRLCALPLGKVPASAVAMLHVTEVVVHGWDIGQATGERAVLPEELAAPVLEFSRQFDADAHRGTAFGAEREPDGDTAADRLLAYLGRTP